MQIDLMNCQHNDTILASTDHLKSVSNTPSEQMDASTFVLLFCRLVSVGLTFVEMILAQIATLFVFSSRVPQHKL